MLYSLSGVRYGQHLLMWGDFEEALKVSMDNLEFCRQQGWQSDVALILALLTMIPSDMNEDELREHSEDSVDLARALGGKQVLTEALLARGQFARQRKLAEESLIASDEALTISQSFGFRRCEVDTRTVRAAAFADLSNTTNARAEASLARDLAIDLGYRRAQVLAEKLLSGLESPGPGILS
jgi:hypothetical protein